jgi:hypothetical protein
VLLAALTPLQVKSKKRERSFMREGLQINDLPVVKSSSIPKEENNYV